MNEKKEEICIEIRMYIKGEERILKDSTIFAMDIARKSRLGAKGFIKSVLGDKIDKFVDKFVYEI